MKAQTNIQALNNAARTFTNELNQEFLTFGRALKVVNDSCKCSASAALKAAGIAFFAEIGVKPGKLSPSDMYHNAAGDICTLSRTKWVKKVRREYVSASGEKIVYYEQYETVKAADGSRWGVLPMTSYSFAKVIAAAKSAKVFAKIAQDVETKQAAKAAAKSAKVNCKAAKLFAQLQTLGFTPEDIASRMANIA